MKRLCWGAGARGRSRWGWRWEEGRCRRSGSDGPFVLVLLLLLLLVMPKPGGRKASGRSRRGGSGAREVGGIDSDRAMLQRRRVDEEEEAGARSLRFGSSAATTAARGGRTASRAPLAACPLRLCWEADEYKSKKTVCALGVWDWDAYVYVCKRSSGSIHV